MVAGGLLGQVHLVFGGLRRVKGGLGGLGGGGRGQGLLAVVGGALLG